MTDEQRQVDFGVKTGKPAENALALAGYTTLDDLTSATAAELLALHGVGPKAVRILGEALAAQGKSFRAPSV